jgi:hypothetical protein
MKTKKTFTKKRLENLDKAIQDSSKSLKIKKGLKKIERELDYNTFSGIFKEEYGDILEKVIKDFTVVGEGIIKAKYNIQGQKLELERINPWKKTK